MSVDITPVLSFAGMGLTFGLAGGLSPGPLTALVVSQTVRFGLREGCTVALAPVLTDGPLILLSALAVGGLAHLSWALAGVSFIGAIFLLWLSYETITAAPISLTAGVEPQSLRKSLVTNVLNPHPYLFWLTVGGPLVVEGFRAGWAPLTAFLAAFFVSIVGAKMTVAWVAARFRSQLGGPAYRWTMGILGVAMLGFAVAFVRKGLGLLGG